MLEIQSLKKTSKATVMAVLARDLTRTNEKRMSLTIVTSHSNEF